ncbi:MAG: universal stress protein [Oligoflexia bacterium]|nr:universal stress protein [Oligoflexia bacterium]
MPQNALKKILVPIDESERSRKAIPLARTIAQLAGGSLHLLHSAPEHPGPAESPRALRQRLRLASEELEGAILEQVPGPASRGVPEKATESPQSMIVISSFLPEEPRPAGGLSAMSEQILRNAICPVLLVPPDPAWEKSWRPTRILLPQDSTEETATAIGPAIALATQNQARLLVLHVPRYSAESLSAEHAALPFPRYMDQPQHEFPAWKQEFTERLRELARIPPELDIELQVALGEPAEEILNWSRKLAADLLAIPWYGNYENAGILRKVLAGVDRPVLTLPFRRRLTRK